MKRFISWVMLAAAFGAVETLMGQDDAADSAETQEEGAADVTDSQKLEELKQKLGKIDESFAAIKAPREYLKSRVARTREDAEKRIASIAEKLDKINVLSQQSGSVYSAEFAFQIVPVEDRTKFSEEGEAKVKKVIALLNGKEADQINGIILFEQIRERYQGAPKFQEASAIFIKTVSKLERKWRSAKDRIEKDRQKMNSNNRSKVENAEDTAYQRLEQKMRESGKDVNRDWFVPGAKYASNLKALDRLIQRVKATQQSPYNQAPSGAESVPELLRTYWEKMDEVVRLMQAGEVDQAKDLLSDIDKGEFHTISSLPRSSVPEEVRTGIRDQHSKVRSEINSRVTAARNADREYTRAKDGVTRDISNVERMLDGLLDDISNAKEEEVQREAEEAERRAEEERQAEEERKAALEEEAEDEEPIEEPAPKKKKSKKKKAE